VGLGGEARPEGLGMGFLGRGQPARPHQLGGLEQRCKLPQRGDGAEPRPPKGFLVFCAVRLPFPASQYVFIDVKKRSRKKIKKTLKNVKNVTKIKNVCKR